MVDAPSFSVNLPAYFSRIGFNGDFRPTVDTFAALHEKHATSIPFENLDILLGRPIRIDLESIQAKLVHGGRGGYCFEQNTLLSAVLEQIGFRVTLLSARVRLGSARILPHTHMLLEVEAEGRPFMADVGFGTAGLLRPIPLIAGPLHRQEAWTYRLAENAGLWILQSLRDGEWLDLYAFTREPQFPIDFEVANHYVSTYPNSRFTQTLTVQRTALEARFKMVNHDFTVDRGTEVVSRTLDGGEELLTLLGETFGLSFPPGTRFRSPFEGGFSSS